MKVDLLQKPQAITMCQWDGTNTDEVNAYLAENDSSYGRGVLVVDTPDSARLVSDFQYQTAPDKPVRVGDWIWAVTASYWPSLAVLSAAEVNARYYPYPDYAEPVPDPWRVTP